MIRLLHLSIFYNLNMTSSSADDLKKKLISSNIAQDYQLVGCSFQELIHLEEKYGSLPASYKQIMLLLGRRAGKLVDRYEFDFYIDQIPKLNEDYLEIVQETLEDMGRPSSIFLICSRYGSGHNFVLTNSGNDSPVFVWRETEEIEQIYSSVWEWIDDFIEDAKAIMNIQSPENWKQNL